MLRLVFLGKLADAAGVAAMDLAADGPCDWSALLSLLPPDLAAAVQGEKVRVAMDGEVLTDKAALVALPGSEIAFFPPVSGG